MSLAGLKFLDSVKKMPLMHLPVRSVFVGLSNSGVLISPGSNLNLTQLKSIEGLTDIVAPNLFHCGGVEGALRVFPKARVWGPASAKKIKPEIPWTNYLTDSSWSFNQELKMISIRGMPKVQESVFVHLSTKTLIVSDLCFNLTDASGIGARIILGLFGTYKKFAISRFFLKFVQDKRVFLDSLDEVLAADFENVVVGHGSPILSDGKSRLKAAVAAIKISS